MKLSTTRVFPLALMAALALLSFYLERAVRDEEAAPPIRRHDPDYIVSNFTATTYNPAGAAESMLSAAKMIHYPDDDSTELVEPRLVQTKPDEPRMTVRAERGALSRDGDEVFLWDSVLLTREADRGRAQARLTTSFLHVVRDKSLALTDREVNMEEGTRSLAGRGMEYNYDTGQMILRGNVRGRFEPKAGS
jgi:lipopolysaccharide export system protein LptC